MEDLKDFGKRVEFERRVFAAIIYFATERPGRRLVNWQNEFLRAFAYAVISYLHEGSRRPAPETAREAFERFGSKLPDELRELFRRWAPPWKVVWRTETQLFLWWNSLVWDCDSLGPESTWRIPETKRTELRQLANLLPRDIFMHAACFGVHLQHGMDRVMEEDARRAVRAVAV